MADSVKRRLDLLEHAVHQTAPTDDPYDLSWMGGIAIDESEPPGTPFRTLERHRFLRERSIVRTGKDPWGPPDAACLATADLPRERPAHLPDFLPEVELMKLVKPDFPAVEKPAGE